MFKRRWGKVSVQSWTRGLLVPCLGWADLESRQGRKCGPASTSCESTNQSQSHMPLALSGPGHVFSSPVMNATSSAHYSPTHSLFLPLLYMFSAFHLMTCWSIAAELWGNQFFSQVNSKFLFFILKYNCSDWWWCLKLLGLYKIKNFFALAVFVIVGFNNILNLLNNHHYSRKTSNNCDAPNRFNVIHGGHFARWIC